MAGPVLNVGRAAVVTALIALTACAAPISGRGLVNEPVRSYALARRLEPKPPGATGWRAPWGPNETPTITQYVQHFWRPDSRAGATAALTADGLQAVAHTDWIAADGDQVDIVLLQFPAASVAERRYVSAVSGWTATAHFGPVAIDVPATVNATAFQNDVQDAYRNTQTIVTAYAGRVELAIYYFSPDADRLADLARWTLAQLAQLR